MRILTLIFAVLLSACATGPNMRQLRVGMSRTDVISILGDPDGVQQSTNYEALKYTNRLIDDWWSWDRADYNVILKDGKVVEYGAGQVRQNAPPGTLLIAPIPIVR